MMIISLFFLPAPGVKYAYGCSIGAVLFIFLILLIAWLDGQFAPFGRCGRGPKSCLGLDRLREGPRTRRLPSYTSGQTPAMLLLTGQHEKFEQLAAEEWQKKTDAYAQQARRLSTASVSTISDGGRRSVTASPEKIPHETRPASLQRKGKDKLQRLKSAREEVPQGLY